MSTEFFSETTEQLAFVRWGRGSGNGLGFEFGSVTNFERCVSAARSGETFFPCGNGWQSSSPEDFSAEALEAMAASGAATFGEFPFTLEVGSGDMFRLFEEM